MISEWELCFLGSHQLTLYINVGMNIEMNVNIFHFKSTGNKETSHCGEGATMAQTDHMC